MDYVLLSLVRTNHVGHLKDERRLTVALSRARLGLYIFCRLDLFAKSQVGKIFKSLEKKGKDLKLLKTETFGVVTRGKEKSTTVKDVVEMGIIVEDLGNQ
jgi:intron-binding protein aquarius